MDKRKKITVLYNGKVVGYLGDLEERVVGGHTSSGCLTVFSTTQDRTDAEDSRAYQVTY